jgi:OFA family oxalate/formate antiporter-like MFS transporter
MIAAFTLESVAFLLMSRVGASPNAFVLVTCLVFFAYGEIFSLFPATCADSYGRKFASANSGLLYTAKGAASLLVPLSSVIAANFGGWSGLFVVIAVMNLVAAALALVLLKPMRARLSASGR